MPELPEVESIKLQLKKFIVGHKILNIEIRYGKKFEGEKGKVEGAKIQDVRRFAKALVIDLSNSYSIVIHVKLTGQLIYEGPNLKKGHQLSKKVIGGLGGKHTHIIFHLDKGGKLYFNDVRKFGWMKVIQKSKLKNQTEFIGKLGPEPLINANDPPENPLTLDKFREILSKSSQAIKIVLMDQEKISGVGNIYANDALWLAGIKPVRKAKDLREDEVKKLFKSIIDVLKEGIKRGGASELAFVTPDGSEGKYQDFTLVYGREGESCKNCKTAIRKIKIGGRGTYFCPNCQS